MSEIVNGNPLDQNKSGKTRVKHTKFQMDKHLFGTYRFGEYGFAFKFNGIAGDRIRVRQGNDVNSYTLKAPLLTPITMNKSYFMVPRMAILPKTWDKIFENPSIGDDIDATRYGTSIKPETLNRICQRATYLVKTIITRLREYTDQTEVTSYTVNETIQYILETLTFGELFFSNGSLVNAMGAKLSRLFKLHKQSFDGFFEEVVTVLKQNIGYINCKKASDNRTYFVIFDERSNVQVTTSPVIDFRKFLEFYRDGEYFDILNCVTIEGYIIQPLTFFENLKEWADKHYSEHGEIEYIEYEKPFDLAPLWAYQLSCAEFFTNDKVDHIYNAELFRQYIENLYLKYKLILGDEAYLPRYTYNGIMVTVDALSAEITYGMRDPDINWGFDDFERVDGYQYARAYWFALFKYNRSLKYKDYFTGARTRPIAIGDTNVEVNDDVVEVIDIVKNIQKQRFLNVVNKIPRDLKGYTKGIFGVDVAPDWHNPLFLARTSTTIYGQETENTGEAQLSEKQTRTSVLKNVGGNIEFSFKLDRNSIIIGVIGFDIPRAYSKGVERSFMDVDRFDYFNPYLQYTGDQVVYGEELDARKTETFGYQGNYMHMKQEYNEAFGGFIEDLKGWTFLDRYVEKEDLGNIDFVNHVGPDFIRSKPTELDRFYISLSGDSLANYFHFIIDTETHIEANRPMSYNPQILG